MSPLLLIPLFYFAAVVQLWLSVDEGGPGPDCVVRSQFARSRFQPAVAGLGHGDGRFCRRFELLLAIGNGHSCVLFRWSSNDLAAQLSESRRILRQLLSGLDGRDRDFAALTVFVRCQGVTNLPWRMLIEQSMLIGLSTFMVSIPWLLLANFTGKRRTLGMLLVEV